MRITKFASTKSTGAGWDPASGADLYFVLSKNSSLIFDAGAFLGTYTDADPTKTYEFEITSNVEFSDPKATYQVDAYDYDPSSGYDDWLGGLTFTPYSNGQNFPTTIYISSSTEKNAFEIDVEYIW